MACSKSLPSVSILTVSQYSRRECMIVLAELIRNQSYKNVLEWVIVEGSQTEVEANSNYKYLFSHSEITNLPFTINYISYDGELGSKPRYLSDLRNIGNEACCGEIIVCMDDDDYYPPMRISHAVDMLSSSTREIAGCSRAYIYFYLTKKFFQSKSFGKGHSTNNCLAYKRSYLDTHSYKTGLSRGEEPSFTNDFTERMIQLNPEKTIVISGHDKNTVDKKNICSSEQFTELYAPTITGYVPWAFLLKFERIFENM